MLKKIIAAVSAAALLAISIPLTTAFTSSAEDVTSVVVLGDSISTGYGLANKDYSYGSLVADYYGAQIENYAVDGATTGDLLNLLESGGVDSALSDADVILVTIGGNDTLQPALSIIYSTLDKYNIDTSQFNGIQSILDTFTSKDQAILDDVVDQLADLDLSTTGTNLSSIFEKLAVYEDAKIIFQQMYNPMDVDTSDSSWTDSQKNKLSKINMKMNGYANDTNYYLKKYAKSYSNIEVAQMKEAFSGHGEFYTNISDLDIHPNQAGHLLMASEIITMIGANDATTGKMAASYYSLSSENKEKYSEMGDYYTRLMSYIDISEPPTESPTTTTTTTTTPTTTAVTTTTVTETPAETTTTTDITKMFGDLNDDKQINSSDAVIILKDFANQILGNTSSLDPEIADINSDGKINSSDAVIILKYFANSIINSNIGSLEDFIKA
jgi:lysophospholipase L1-like esterase